MSKLPFKEYDLVRRTAVDYAPELDQEQGITRDMIGEVVGIDRLTPMFTVLFSLTQESVYLTDELEKVGYRIHDWNTGKHTDVML